MMTAEDFLPPRRNLTALRQASRECQGCDLYKSGTQTVFGEGLARARLMLVGEQPGDQEDLEGRPFVGPAGRLLDKILEEAGLDRREAYVTNAVKHFKWEPRGQRRLHKKPSSRELSACRPWLDAEFDVINPKVVVCLGATAAQQLFGRNFRITSQHGEWQQTNRAHHAMATWHPSAVLRVPDPDQRQHMRDELIQDLMKAVAKLSE